MQGHGSGSIHDKGILFACGIFACAERHRGGCHRHTVEQALPGNDLAVVVILRQVGYGNHVGFVTSAGGQVDIRGIGAVAIIDQVYLVGVCGIDGSLRGRRIDLQAFGFGMDKEGEAVHPLLVSCGIGQRGAQCAGLHPVADRCREAHHAVRQRVGLPADLLLVAREEKGQSQEHRYPIY